MGGGGVVGDGDQLEVVVMMGVVFWVVAKVVEVVQTCIFRQKLWRWCEVVVAMGLVMQQQRQHQGQQRQQQHRRQ